MQDFVQNFARFVDLRCLARLRLVDRVLFGLAPSFLSQLSVPLPEILDLEDLISEWFDDSAVTLDVSGTTIDSAQELLELVVRLVTKHKAESVVLVGSVAAGGKELDGSSCRENEADGLEAQYSEAQASKDDSDLFADVVFHWLPNKLRSLRLRDPTLISFVRCFYHYIEQLEELEISLTVDSSWRIRAWLYSAAQNFQRLQRMSIHLTYHEDQQYNRENLFSLIGALLHHAPQLSKLTIEGDIKAFFGTEMRIMRSDGETDKLYLHPMLDFASRLWFTVGSGVKSMLFHVAKEGLYQYFEAMASGFVDEDPWLHLVTNEISDGILAADLDTVPDASVIRMLDALSRIHFDFSSVVNGATFGIQLLAHRASRSVFDAVVRLGIAHSDLNNHVCLWQVLCSKTRIQKNQLDMMYWLVENRALHSAVRGWIGDLNVVDLDGCNLLHNATCVDFAAFLVNTNPWLVTGKNKSGLTPAKCAKTPEILKEIIQFQIRVDNVAFKEEVPDLMRYHGSQRLYGHVQVLAETAGGLPTSLARSILLEAFDPSLAKLTETFVRKATPWRGIRHCFDTVRASKLLTNLFRPLTTSLKLELVDMLLRGYIKIGEPIPYSLLKILQRNLKNIITIERKSLESGSPSLVLQALSCAAVSAQMIYLLNLGNVDKLRNLWQQNRVYPLHSLLRSAGPIDGDSPPSGWFSDALCFISAMGYNYPSKDKDGVSALSLLPKQGAQVSSWRLLASPEAPVRPGVTDFLFRLDTKQPSLPETSRPRSQLDPFKLTSLWIDIEFGM